MYKLNIDKIALKGKQKIEMTKTNKKVKKKDDKVFLLFPSTT